MPKDRKDEAWARAIALAQSGKFSSAGNVEDQLRAEGFLREVDDWRGKWEHERLKQLCRDAKETGTHA